MEFVPFDLDGATHCRPLLADVPDRFCDWTVGCLYIWKEYYAYHYALSHGCVLLRGQTESGRFFYSPPVGSGDREAALADLEAHCAATGTPLQLAPVSPEDTAWLLSRYGDGTRVISSEDTADYLYRYEDLATLAGRRYSGQRNHIHQFEKKWPSWQYQPLSPALVPQVEAFLMDLLTRKQQQEELSPGEIADILASVDLLPHIETLHMTGGVILVDGQVAGFSIGEVRGDTLYVHIEKGDTRYSGIYQLLVREYAAHTAAPHLHYINREDDAGDAGLRRSKRSYHPCALLEKNLVIPPVTTYGKDVHHGNDPHR